MTVYAVNEAVVFASVVSICKVHATRCWHQRVRNRIVDQGKVQGDGALKNYNAGRESQKKGEK